MKRALAAAVVAFACLAPARAWATSHCHDASSVVGRHHCRAFASGWSPPSMRWELGLALLHFDLPPLDSDVLVNGRMEHVSTPGGALTALGPRMRSAFGYHGWYVGDEISVAFASRAPRVAADPLARGAPVAPSMIGTANAVTALLVVGKSATVGRAFLGAEAAFGMHAASLAPPDAKAGVSTIDVALEARARGGVWLSRWLSLSAVIGTDVLRRDDYSVGLVVGLHLFPYDGTR